MLDLLAGLAQGIGGWVLWALVSVINLLIEAVGLLITGLLLLCPGMPDPPTSPVGSWLGWLNWLIPVAPLIAALVVFVGLWVAFLIVRIPLKWVKAL